MLVYQPVSSEESQQLYLGQIYFLHLSFFTVSIFVGENRKTAQH